MTRRFIPALLALLLAGAAGGTVVTAQILDYERGFIFFTTGDGFRVAPNVAVVRYDTGAPLAQPPRVRQYARVTFDPSGVVTKIEVSQKPLPPEGTLESVDRFAVALSSPVPNPDLANTPNPICAAQPGKQVTVTFNVEVPPTTRITDNVYMTTDTSGWNPQAYRLDRVDALHYRTALRFESGTVLQYLFDRGSDQSTQRDQHDMPQQPYTLCVGDEDAQAARAIVYHWADESGNGVQTPPQVLPTPFNPAPFPNLPTPAPRAGRAI